MEPTDQLQLKSQITTPTIPKTIPLMTSKMTTVTMVTMLTETLLFLMLSIPKIILTTRKLLLLKFALIILSSEDVYEAPKKIDPLGLELIDSPSTYENARCPTDKQLAIIPDENSRTIVEEILRGSNVKEAIIGLKATASVPPDSWKWVKMTNIIAILKSNYRNLLDGEAFPLI